VAKKKPIKISGELKDQIR